NRAEQEQKQQRDSGCESRPQVRVVQRSRGQARPESVVGGEAEQKGEEAQTGDRENRGSEDRPSHSSSWQRDRTNEMTALARSRGTSRGFRSFKVLPVAS